MIGALYPQLIAVLQLQVLHQTTGHLQFNLEIFGHWQAVAHHQHSNQLVVRLHASTNEPRCLTRVQTAFDEESVAWLCAVVVSVIELKGLEGVV